MNRNDVVDTAKKYKGYQGNPNIFTKWYSKDNKTHAWCGMFVKYIFKHDLNCDWLDSCSNFAYVPTIVSWAKSKGYWTTSFTRAMAGDLVVYNWYPDKKNHYSHVGIVESTKSSGVNSIEGNTTSGGKSNYVAEKSRGKKYVAGVILLPFTYQYSLNRLLKPGCRGDDVKDLQAELKRRGYDLGRYGKNKDGIDGIFGTTNSKTSKAVRQFQKDNGLTADTKVGKNTAHALGWLYKGK